MDLQRVFKVCLGFAIGCDGTVTGFSGRRSSVVVESRDGGARARVCDRDCSNAPGQWVVTQERDARGVAGTESTVVSSEDNLLECLSRFWDVDGASSASARCGACI